MSTEWEITTVTQRSSLFSYDASDQRTHGRKHLADAHRSKQADHRLAIWSLMPIRMVLIWAQTRPDPLAELV
jgi:hypothetical protein